MNDKKPLIIIAGPTAVGKSAISIKLAKDIGGEIISADSVQVYRHMDIGSAKITKDEMQGVKHYLIDVLDPKDEFSAALFKDMAKNAAEEIYDNGHIPIVVGGTGFYIQGLLYDIDFKGNPVNEEYRSYLLDYADKNGNEALHDILKKIDPEAAKQIHPNNVKRVMRALEFNKDTGKKISEHNDEQHERSSPYDFCYFVLTDERETLYRRIDERVDNMMSEGLTDEVRQLLDMGCTKDMVSMQALGYRQLIPYIKAEETSMIDNTYNTDNTDSIYNNVATDKASNIIRTGHEGELAKAIRDIKEETRHFAKRQLTWFRREKDVIWIDKNEFDHDYTKILDFMEKKMKERGLL